MSNPEKEPMNQFKKRSCGNCVAGEDGFCMNLVQVEFDPRNVCSDHELVAEFEADFKLRGCDLNPETTERGADETCADDIKTAYAEAARLVAEFGEDHPAALRAIVHTVNLADPTFLERTLAAVGIQLPQASHRYDNGEPVFSIDAIAEMFGVSTLDAQERMQELGLLPSSTTGHRTQ